MPTLDKITPEELAKFKDEGRLPEDLSPEEYDRILYTIEAAWDDLDWIRNMIEAAWNINYDNDPDFVHEPVRDLVRDILTSYVELLDKDCQTTIRVAKVIEQLQECIDQS